MDPTMDPNAKPPAQPGQTAAYLAADKGPSIVAVCTAISAISTISVAARIFTRQKIMGKLHLDDYLVALAVPFQWTAAALAVIAVNNGNGKHFDTLSLNQKQGAIFWTIIGFPFGIMAFGIPKLAVVALLRRLMNPNKWHHIFLWSLSSLCVAVLLGCVVILYAQCSPVQSQWDFSITDKKCISPWVLVNYAIFSGGLSAFTDLYLAVYPAVVLWKLQINIRKKIALCFALGIGSIATVVAIYKCTRLPALASADFSYDTSDLVVWTIVEAGTIIIACCIPVLQPLVDLIFGRRTLNGSSGYRHYGSSKDGQMKSDIEMDKSGRSRGLSGNRSQVTTKNTLTSRTDDIDADSQDSILHDDDSRKLTKSHPRRPTAGKDGRIVRTDSVTVTYDMDGSHAPQHPAVEANKSWVRM